MKVKLLIVLSVLLVLLIGVAVFFDPIIDALPIDQSGWKTNETGVFYLDEDGDPVTGWQKIEGKRYYFDENNGKLYTGLVSIDLEIYQMDENGVMQTGWVDGRYFREEGPMALGWTVIGEKTFYFAEDGLPLTGWQQFGETRFCFGEDGVMTTGWLEDGESRYYMGEDGIMRTGWLETAEGRYYLTDEGTAATGWLDLDGKRYYLNEDCVLVTGWLQTDEGLYYLNEDGTTASGWQEIDGVRYYLNGDGSPYTGWLEEDGKKYYLKEDGTLAVGKLVLDEQTWFFSSTGEQIYMVNPWNYLPEDYTVDLTKLENGHTVATEMVDALLQMLADCEAAGHKPYLYSSYRTQAHQQRLFNNMLQQEGSYAAAARIVAVPGTSEHQLGLAVDITDSNFRKLNKQQEKTETQKWLMEHCWDYGFILRYPSEKSAITGIIYEPWHYRYVGPELAQEIKELGLCLEEYLDMLTNDGTTCGGAS